MYEYNRRPERGGIYYIEREQEKPLGHEQWSGRPGIVVSAGGGGYTCMVVYLTTREDRPDPDGVHVEINSAAKPSRALCDQVKTVDVRFLGRYFGHITDEEERAVTDAVRRALGIPGADEDDEEEYPNAYEDEERRKVWRVDEPNKEIDGLIAELTKAKADADAWQRVALHLMERSA